MSYDAIPNNPRSVGEAVSVDAWRTPFDPKSGIADVFVDVVFGIGLHGGGDAAVRFRLALLGATVHVNVGQSRVLEVLPESVHREFSFSSGRKVVEIEKTGSKRSVAASVSTKASAAVEMPAASVSGSMELDARADRSLETSREVQSSYEAPAMRVIHRKTPSGYAFDITSNEGARLRGLAWDPLIRRLSVADNKMYRKTGEPPEPLIEVLVRREQIEIFDVQFTSGTSRFMNMHRNKQMVAIQHLKDVLFSKGLHVQNLDDPFASIKIADVSPQEKRNV